MLFGADGRPIAVAANYLRKRWAAIGDKLTGGTGVAEDLAWLVARSKGDFEVVSQSGDGRRWLLAVDADVAPRRYLLFERGGAKRRLEQLFVGRPELDRIVLRRMHPLLIRARDGLALVAYLTLPDGSPDRRPPHPWPLVLYVHGGPWDRDTWGYSPKDQWLADRGYAVLRVNFRGSTGLGKRFINLANGQWAGTMHDDVVDALRWAVRRGLADPKRVAIMGGSYGGYATLVGLTFTPDLFACGVARVAWADLRSYLGGTAAYNRALLDIVAARVGDPRTERGRAALLARSPIARADRLRAPLLVAQGKNDPRARPEEITRFDRGRAQGADHLPALSGRGPRFPAAGLANLLQRRDRAVLAAVPRRPRRAPRSGDAGRQGHHRARRRAGARAAVSGRARAHGRAAEAEAEPASRAATKRRPVARRRG